MISVTLVIRIGRFKPRLGLFKRFKRLREYLDTRTDTLTHTLWRHNDVIL